MKRNCLYEFVRRSVLSVMLAAALCASARSVDPAMAANEPLLARLDSIIAADASIVSAKRQRIDDMRKSMRGLSSPIARLGIERQLFDEYLVFDSDSALACVARAEKLVPEIAPDDYLLVAEWLINRGSVYVVQGLYDEALARLGKVDTGRLDLQQKCRYFNAMTTVHVMHGLYLKDNSEIWEKEVAKAVPYLDSLTVLGRGDDRLLWVPVARSIFGKSGPVSDSHAERLRSYVDGSTEPSRDTAINSYWLSRLYTEAGNDELAMRYMVLSAINDALISNRDISAMQAMAFHAFEDGQVERAYSYLTYVINQANRLHSRCRMVNMADMSASIRQAYRQELEQRDRRMCVLVLLLGALALLLVGSVVYIVLENRKLSQARHRLAEINAALRQSNAERTRTIADLEVLNRQFAEANARLKEANIQKLGVLAYALRLTSRFAESLEGYRKKLLRKYRAKDLDGLGQIIADQDLVKEQYQSYYEGFDHMVLSLFPSLADDYNATVADDLKVAPHAVAKSKTLNTRLRIYALKRLGVSKSADIADMLNVSIRTVYNNRGGAGVAPPDAE